MKPINTLLDVARANVRRFMRQIARALNNASRGKLHPMTVTLTGLLAHIPIAWLIATERLAWAAALLVIFGLFDTLDGELARLQKKASPAGMLLDATTDRMKEVILYMGIAYYLFHSGNPNTDWLLVAAVAATGASLLVSYVKSKGESAVATSNIPHHELNYLFADGLLRFEIRMFALVVGLLFNQLPIAIVFVAVGAWLTALERLVKISRKLA